MRKITFQQKRNVEGMRKKGNSYLEISKKLKISKSTIHNYGKDIKISDKGLARLNKRMEDNRERFIQNFATARKIREPGDISVNLVRILGHCLFDGCVRKDGVIYTNSSKELIKQFSEDMKKVFGVKPDLIRKMFKKSYYWVLYFNYTKISNFLIKFSHSYSTSSTKSRIPSFLFDSNPKFISEYLRCFWDDEGAVKSNGDITGKTKSKNIANQLVKLHNKLGIEIKTYFDTKNLAYELYVPRRENLQKFKNSIGFGHGKVCRGKFRGFSKSDALNLVSVN
jgi:hypothetical protein